MADTRDPIDHFRTTHKHAGESFIDVYAWPGVVSITIGVISLVCCVAAAAYQRHDLIVTTGIVGALATAGGIAWLVVEHHRIVRLEQRWLAEHSDSPAGRSPAPSRSS
ncbi:UsfY protein [Mycobacterium lentiflavum]|uniref:UsfY protein n=1 Tax=Mycobacterium lentiflavum TaxID=141349 RepID=A0A0E3WE37_MYCLN|nr:protein UsfY [Mycobacterium lentiflavum]CQD22937.1 UsfY protein [Mycobacterium lentiflavum]